MLHNAGQRLRKMSPAQQGRIFYLNDKIKNCEGEEIPSKYWCTSCKIVWNKLYNVFTNFEIINAKRAQCRDTSIHSGFSEFDST